MIKLDGDNYGKKIDNKETDGLNGVSNSLAYRIEEIEKHFHNRERWFGISADQSGNDWALDTLTPFRAISGNNDYGSDPNDEAKVLGTDDTPAITDMIKFDIHRLFIVAVSQDTPYKLCVSYGSGTLAAAIAANQCTQIVIMSDVTNPQQSSGNPFHILMPRVNCGIDKIWIRAWNVTDNATIDFLVGIHEYEG